MKAMLKALGVGNMPPHNQWHSCVVVGGINKAGAKVLQSPDSDSNADAIGRSAFILGIRASQWRIEDLLLCLAEHGVLVDALNDIKEGKFDFSQFIKKGDASTTEAGKSP